MQAKWYYYIPLGLVDVEANYLGKNIVIFLVCAVDFYLFCVRDQEIGYCKSYLFFELLEFMYFYSRSFSVLWINF